MLRKVRSRGSESTRNDAWLSVGRGRVRGPEGETAVLFVCPGGSRGAERLVLPEAMVRTVDPGAPGDADPSTRGTATHHVPHPSASIDRVLGESAAALRAMAGWDPHEDTSAAVDEATWDRIRALVAAPPAATFEAADPRPGESEVTERIGASVPGDRPRYHLFGYGQYAKTQAIPNLGEHLDLAAVHELDPLQIGPVLASPPAEAITWDTSPVLRPDEAIRNAVVAGYHHTHATLAADLIEQGARHVVIEKPTASKEDQLDRLLAAMDHHGEARVHVAFQRRYSPFNRLLRRDLGDGPISVASTVYEVPLPPRHWYRWPVVGNAVVSNGCHWIDHFLFLNDHRPVVDAGAKRLADQVVLWLELEGGATCTLSLRHAGSPRLGVRDLCTFWSGNTTAVIEDNSRYSVERGFRRGRTVTCHRYASHEAMYREIGRRIRKDLPGDDRQALETSARTVLDLARRLDADP